MIRARVEQAVINLIRDHGDNRKVQQWLRCHLPLMRDEPINEETVRSCFKSVGQPVSDHTLCRIWGALEMAELLLTR
jgi:hypothetical protein